jgi:hypothetical protein
VQKHNRRAFLQASAGALAIGLNSAPALNANATQAEESSAFTPNQMAPAITSNEGKKPLRLGLIIAMGKDPDAAMAKVRDLGRQRARPL